VDGTSPSRRSGERIDAFRQDVIGQNHAAGVRQSEGDLPSDAATGTRDQRYASLEARFRRHRGKPVIVPAMLR
jgi:hypothetical protein